MEKEKINEVIAMTMELGFNMGVTSMRLRMMETLMPYIDAAVLTSNLLTTRDVIKMMSDTMTDFNLEQEYELIRATMKGLGNHEFPPKI